MLDTIYRLGNTVSNTYVSVTDDGFGFSYSKIRPNGRCSMMYLKGITGVSFCPMGVVTFQHLDDVREWEVLG